MGKFLFDTLSLDDLKALLGEVLRSNPPDSDKAWIKACAEEIARREKQAAREAIQ
jgi:hypothetical protein